MRKPILWTAGILCFLLAGCSDLDLRNILVAYDTNQANQGSDQSDTATKYTVTYFPNGATGGNVPTDSTKYMQYNNVTVLANTGNLVKSGFTFAGWNTQADGSGTDYFAGETPPMGQANISFYAIWIPSNLTFTTSGTDLTITGFTTTPTEAIVIPGGVTRMQGYIFENCAGITAVTFPSSMTRIESYAFDKCAGLASVTIPSSVTDIGNSAFWNDVSLTSVTIPSSVNTIEPYAFYGCGFTSFTIPSGVISIGNATFMNCVALLDVYEQATTPPTLPSSSGAFSSEKSGFKIHVPTSALTAYETADGWKDYYSPTNYFISP